MIEENPGNSTREFIEIDIKRAVVDGIKETKIKRTSIIIAVIGPVIAALAVIATVVLQTNSDRNLLGTQKVMDENSLGTQKVMAQEILASEVQYTQEKEATQTQGVLLETQNASIISPGGETPNPTATSLPTITPILLSPSATGDLGVTQAPEKIIPEEIIRQYYDHLNWEEYGDAWNMLDKDLQAAMDISFEEYVDYWEDTIPVSITQLLVERETEYSADLIVSLYFSRYGYSKSHRFGLVFELPEDRWQINSVVSYIEE